MVKITSLIIRALLASYLLFVGGAPQRITLGQNSETVSEGHLAPSSREISHETGRIDLQDIPDSYEFIAENELYQLYVNKATLAFKVVVNRSGYVWSSNLDTKETGDRLNTTWTAFAQSGISIDYIDEKLNNNRASVTNANVSIKTAPVEQGMKITVQFLDPMISFDVIYHLEDTGVSVEIPFASVTQENPNIRLGILYAFPFLGATREDSVPGYMFIPDGSGSLIRFGKSTKASTMFYGKYYGDDLGMITSLPRDPTVNPPLNISIPVMGMAHEDTQNAYICIVEKGAPYGEIQAHPGGLITNFNFILNAFMYNQTYFQATNRAGDGVTIIQPNTNLFDIKLQYRFLTAQDSDYVGMARSYQNYLVEKGVLKKDSGLDGNIGVRLEFLGGEKRRILLWDTFIPMTTIAQMETILDDLGIKNPDVVYYGWQKYGASSMTPTSLKVDGQLGSLDQLRSLAGKILEDGGHFYLYFDPQTALRDEGGYSPPRDLAISITNQELRGNHRGRPTYYFGITALNKRYLSLSQNIFTNEDIGLALDGIGNFLYSDYKEDFNLTRQDAITGYQELMSKNPGKMAFYLPNDYMFSFMSAYYDLPLDDNGYIYTTESAPFLQVVLAGYVPYYGPALNFSANNENDLLKQVDFGAYPSYFLTNEVTAKILETNSDWIYTSSYGQWGKAVQQTYQWMNALLGPVEGQEIIARQKLAEGISATTYANGKQVIVNYNDAPFVYNGVTIEGRNASILEVVP